MDLSTTGLLINACRDGDQKASQQLFELYHPSFYRWARGRVPATIRSYMDTEDMVQESFGRMFSKIDELQAKRPGAFFCYLRSIFLNRLKEEFRKNRPLHESMTQFPEETQQNIQKQLDVFLDYDNALSALSESEREVVVMRLDFGLSYQEIAEMTERKTANAARMYVQRSVHKLAEVMASG